MRYGGEFVILVLRVEFAASVSVDSTLATIWTCLKTLDERVP